MDSAAGGQQTLEECGVGGVVPKKQPLASANRLQAGQSGLEACAVCGVSFAKGWGAFHACKGAGQRV